MLSTIPDSMVARRAFCLTGRPSFTDTPGRAADHAPTQDGVVLLPTMRGPGAEQPCGCRPMLEASVCRLARPEPHSFPGGADCPRVSFTVRPVQRSRHRLVIHAERASNPLHAHPELAQMLGVSRDLLVDGRRSVLDQRRFHPKLRSSSNSLRPRPLSASEGNVSSPASGLREAVPRCEQSCLRGSAVQVATARGRRTRAYADRPAAARL